VFDELGKRRGLLRRRSQNAVKIFVATYPFGQCSPEPIHILEKTGWDISYNSLGRRLKPGEVSRYLKNIDGVIAGTEKYDRATIEFASNLKVISRVGVGLDSIDFQACQDKKIIVTYTPEAPADSVADLTIAQIINLLRGIHLSNQSVKNGLWNRILGKLIEEIKIGILGVGRIGKRVIKRLKPFNTDLLACDLIPDIQFGNKYNIKWVNKDELFKQCDLVTIHIPLNKKNYHCVGFDEMSIMKEGSFIINTSRGPVIDENALNSLILNKHLGGAALDVFEEEPYFGILTQIDNVILTAHIGASSKKSRYLMELGAATDCVKVLKKGKPEHEVISDD